MMYGHGYGWLLTLAVLTMFGVAAVLAVLSLARSAQDSLPARHRYTEESEDILRLRYARGDIDTEEFQRRLGMLRGGWPAQRAG
jgi:uncharacterized membrane protein